MSQENNVQEFIERVQWLNEVDHGDFKRKMSLYINRLDESYGKSNKPEKVNNVIATMREKAIYNSSGDIEDVRFTVVELAKML